MYFSRLLFDQEVPKSQDYAYFIMLLSEEIK